MTDQVRITREARDVVNGYDRTGTRVYVTGPHFNLDVFSSTTDPAKATVYDRADAERLIQSKYWVRPALEDVPKEEGIES